MFFVLFLNMKHGKQKVSSPLVGPSCDTQNLVLSELSLLNPSQNFENKIQGLQYIGAWLQYIGAPSSSWLFKQASTDFWSTDDMVIAQLKSFTTSMHT